MRLNQQRDAEDIIQIQDLNVAHLNITMTYKQAGEGLDSVFQLEKVLTLQPLSALLPCCLTTCCRPRCFSHL